MPAFRCPLFSSPHRPARLLPLLLLLTAGLQSARSATVALNISCGYLYNDIGVTTSDLLPVDTLFVLVADVDGNGFDPVPADRWTGGTDIVVLISDAEYSAASGGAYGFGLAAGTTEPGLFSRTLVVDVAQFGNRATPVPVALRWFPGISKNTPVTAGGPGPGPGAAYGEFTRAMPVYTEFSVDPWEIPVTASTGLSLNPDPLATPELGGRDSVALARASFQTVPEPGVMLLTLPAAALLLLLPRRPLGFTGKRGSGIPFCSTHDHSDSE